MDFDYIKLIGELSDEERLKFYECLAHNLTVSARAIWSNEGLTDGEKVERLKWLNEIMHRVTMKSALLRPIRIRFQKVIPGKVLSTGYLFVVILDPM